MSGWYDAKMAAPPQMLATGSVRTCSAVNPVRSPASLSVPALSGPRPLSPFAGVDGVVDGKVGEVHDAVAARGARRAVVLAPPRAEVADREEHVLGDATHLGRTLERGLGVARAPEHSYQSCAEAGAVETEVKVAAVRPMTVAAPSHLNGDFDACRDRDTIPPENECQGADPRRRPSTLATSRPVV